MAEKTITFTISNPIAGKTAVVQGWIISAGFGGMTITAPRDALPSRIIGKSQYNGVWQEQPLPMCVGPNNTWETCSFIGEITVHYTSRGTNYAF
jgi:hypothetical protein